MKMNITTNCEKMIKYRIYDVKGGKRQLNKKGKFKGNTNISCQPHSDEIVIRISKNNRFCQFFKWLGIMILQLFGSTLEAYAINLFYEIRISQAKTDKTLQLFYRDVKSSVEWNEELFEHQDNNNVFYCTNHPSKSETKSIKKINRYFVLLFYILLFVVIMLAFYFGNQ